LSPEKREAAAVYGARSVTPTVVFYLPTDDPHVHRAEMTTRGGKLVQVAPRRGHPCPIGPIRDHDA
jgi:hypothetical protein